jgi:hypothetical protein
MLTAEDREAVSAAFGVPVINMFVSTEGLAGHSEPGGGGCTFVSDTCTAECVDDASVVGPSAVKAYADERYEGLTKAELSDQLAERNLPKTGNVDELTERLIEADSK